MKIALCQTEIVWEEKRENIRRAQAWVQHAAEAGADLVCFPEMSFTGFSMNIGRTAEKERETVSRMEHLAKTYKIAVGFGWTEAAGEKARNHYTVVDGTGKVCSDYVKIHPFGYARESDWFEGGGKLGVFSVGNFRIGTLLCYDLRFPEVFQVLAESCDCIVVAANWPKVRREHWKCLLQARAIECQVYVAGVNCQGAWQEMDYSGDSCVFAPDGRKLGGFLETPEILTVELLEHVQSFRTKFPVRQDRKWDLYSEWYQRITSLAQGSP